MRVDAQFDIQTYPNFIRVINQYSTSQQDVLLGLICSLTTCMQLNVAMFQLHDCYDYFKRRMVIWTLLLMSDKDGFDLTQN